MSNSRVPHNRQKKANNDKIRALKNLLLLSIVTSIKNGKTRYSIGSKITDYEILNFQNCFQNLMPTRIRCPVCISINGGNRAHVFKNCKGGATHLVTDEHDLDRSLLTIEQGLAIIEQHSLSLQLRILGDGI